MVDSKRSNPLLRARVDYACRIVLDFFGELPEKVCRFLLTAGPSDLREVRQGTDLSRKDACKALIVLIQHSFVQALLFQDVESARKVVKPVYKADPQRIATAVRQPAFLVHIADTYPVDEDDSASAGEPSPCWPELVAEQLVHNGRLTFQGVVQRVCAEHAERFDEQHVSSEVSRAIMMLLNDRYIEQAPPGDLPLMHEEDPRKKTRSRSKTTDAQRALETAQKLTMDNYQKLRFQTPHDVLDAGVAGLDVATGGDEGSSEDVVALLRLNFHAFTVHFRNRILMDFLSAGHGQAASDVVEAMLDLSRVTELNATEPSKAPSHGLSVHEISTRYEHNRQRKLADGGMDTGTTDVETTLSELIDQGCVSIQDDGKYVANQDIVTYLTQVHRLKGYLKARFGAVGLRVWNLIEDHKYMPMEHIERMAMINTRTARTIVYGLLKAGFASVQELPKTADRCPSKTFYLYHVDYHDTRAQLVANLYISAGNLLAREAYEMHSQGVIMALLRRRLKGDEVQLSTEQLESLQRLQRKAQVMADGLINVDEMLFLFTDCNYDS